jgi:Siphovirus Gp157
MYRHDADALRREIERLLRDYPELADDEVLRADMLDGSTEIGDILTSLVRTNQDALALKEGTKARLDELKARGDRFTKRTEFVRALIFKIMETARLKKLELPEATLSIRNNPQQIVGDPDAAALPDDLCRIKREPDKKKIRDALLAGQDVPGCTLSNAPPSLMIGVK